MKDEARPAERLLWALDVIGVDYAVVGSVASSTFGEPRATMDIDMVARMTEPMLARLAGLLGDTFYLDIETAKASIRAGRPFNVLSMTNVTKFDFFPVGNDPFGATQLRRKRMTKVDFLSEVEVPVASAEDVVLAKLRWYDQGGRSSERQWSDILGVLRVQGSAIDWAYIEEWAPRLGVGDLAATLPRFD